VFDTLQQPFTDMCASTMKNINPADVAQPGGHYSHGTVANGFVFVSGQLPITPQGEKLVNASFSVQVRQVLANIAAILQACDSSVAHLVQVRAYVEGMENWPEFNRIYAEWAGNSQPSRAVVPTSQLHYGLKVEVEAIAMQGS
jgi:reactive intermediate/imine deaminase